MLLRSLLAALLLVGIPLQASAADTVRIALASLPPTGTGNPFDSSSRTGGYTLRAIFDYLTELKGDMEPHPALATGWKNVNPTTWIVSLRAGVRFSNGEAFDAASVVFTYEFLKSPAAQRYSLSRDVANIASVRAIDELTVEFITTEPDPTFARNLTIVPIVPAKLFTELGLEKFSARPVGTGPFAVEDWGAAGITLRAFTGSWRAPKVDALELIALPDPTGRLQALLSRRVDIALELGPEGVAAAAEEGFRTYQRPPTSVNVISFNATKPGSPFADARVRLAMILAVNRQIMADTIIAGLAPPAPQVTPRANPDYDKSIADYPYDPQRAKALLAEAGYPNGFNIVHVMPLGTSGSDDNAVMQQIAQDLAKIGVRMEIRPIPWAQFVSHILQGGWPSDSFRFEYETLPTGDALRPFRLHSCGWSKQPWYCDEEITPLMAEAKVTFDPARRRDLVHRILKRTHDQAASMPLFEPLGLDSLSPKIAGYSQDAGIIPFAELDIVAQEGGEQR